MEKKKRERKERTDLVTLTAPEGRQYANQDRTMVGKVVTCLAGHEDTFDLITDEEAAALAEGKEAQA